MSDRLVQAINRMKAVGSRWHQINGTFLGIAQSIDPTAPDSAMCEQIANRVLEAADACTELASVLRIAAAELLKDDDEPT